MSSKKLTLCLAWNLPGVKTLTYHLKLKAHNTISISYIQMVQEYIKNCNESTDYNIYQNFAQNILNEIEVNCTNPCVPLGWNPILDTIDHGFGNCQKPEDQYCMINAYSKNHWQTMTKLSKKSLKSCRRTTPKIADISWEEFEDTLNGTVYFDIGTEIYGSREVLTGIFFSNTLILRVHIHFLCKLFRFLLKRVMVKTFPLFFFTFT